MTLRQTLQHAQGLLLNTPRPEAEASYQRDQLITKLRLHFIIPPVPDTPVEILVDILTKATDIATASVNVPEELRNHLQKALDIASGLDDYLEKMTTQESEHLAELYQ